MNLNCTETYYRDLLYNGILHRSILGRLLVIFYLLIVCVIRYGEFHFWADDAQVGKIPVQA